MEKYSIREAVAQAVQAEKLGYQFYTSMAERFRADEGLNSLFTVLATKELQHEKRFSELLGILKDPEPAGWEEAEQYLRAIVESEFFLGKNKSLPSMEKVKTVEDAVSFAVGFEKDTLLYFYGMRDVVKEKEVIDEIINEEMSHIRWLNRFRQGLVK